MARSNVQHFSRFVILLTVSVSLAAANHVAEAQTVFHSARITRVAVHPAANILVTASEDKTVRIWELPSGRPLRVLRPAAGPGPDGQVHALAISPDGKTIAFGGFTGQKNKRIVEGRVRYDYEVYVHDVPSGRRLATLNVPALIDHLVYSPTGEHLVASASEMPVYRFDEINSPLRALTIFRTRDYQAVADVPFLFAAVADYDRLGRLMVVGRPGGHFLAELLDRDLGRLESRTFRGNPAAVKFSPDGSVVVVSTRFAAVHVHSSRDLSLLYDPDLRGASGTDAVRSPPDSPGESTIAWSVDGQFLYYASEATCQPKGCAIRKWRAAGRGPHVDLIVAPNLITHLATLPGGGVAFGTAGPAFGVVDANDIRVLYRDRSGVSRAPVPLAKQPVAPKHRTDKDQSQTSQRSPLSRADEERLAELHQAIATALEKRRPGEALPLAREALQLAELRLPRDDSRFIQPLRDLGRAYHETGRYRAIVGSRGHRVDEYRRAQGHIEDAVALLARDKGPRHPEVADLLEELAAVRAAMKEFDDAIDLKQRIFDIRRSGRDHQRIPQIENDIEILRVKKLIPRELSEALRLALAQLPDAASRLGPSHVNVARGRSNLAAIYEESRLGLRETALRLREQALDLYSRAHGADHWEAVSEAKAIANAYSGLREFAKAERLYESVEQTVASALGLNDPAVMEFLSERAWLLKNLGQHDKAAALFARALAFWEDRLQRGDAGKSAQANLWQPNPILEVRRSLEGLADMYALMGEPAEADRLYGRLLALKEEAGMPPFMVAQVLGKRAAQQRLRGDLASAKSALEDALKLIEKDISRNPGGLHIADGIALRAYEELAAVALASGAPGTARDDLARAVSIHNHILQFYHRPRPADELLDENFDDQFYHRLLALTARHFLTDPAVVASAFSVMLNRKNITLDLQSQTQIMKARLPARAQRSLAELAHTRDELAGLMAAHPAGIARSGYEQKVALSFERARRLEREISSAVAAESWNDDFMSRVTASEVSARLPADTVLVEFVRVQRSDPVTPKKATEPEDDAQYLAFTLTSSGRLSLLDLGAARTIDKMVTDVQSSLRGHGQPALLIDLLQELYTRLWLPLAELVGETGQVIISADGELYRLPFAALMDANAQFLIQRYRFAYLGSGRDLVPAQRLSSISAGQDLVLVANPDFGVGERFTPLPGTAREAQLIPPLVPGNKGRTILVGRAATKSALKSIRSPGILHIATHGVFLARDSLGVPGHGYEHSLVRSGLALAGANHATDLGTRKDGMLTALEVSDMELSGTQLVVLSACDTGVGSVTRGQGVLGLRRAFALAGAKGVLMTLWPVDDSMTAEVMTNFYRNVANLSPAVALHRAQTEVIDRLRTSNGFANPRLWAPFVLESATAFAPLARADRSEHDR